MNQYTMIWKEGEWIHEKQFTANNDGSAIEHFEQYCEDREVEGCCLYDPFDIRIHENENSLS